MPSSDPITALQPLLRQAASARQRTLWVLQGERAWAVRQLDRLTELEADGPWLWVSEHSPPPGIEMLPALTELKPQRSRQVLGREFDGVVLDGHPDLNPDALGACSGTLCAGGLLVLLLPEPQSSQTGVFDQWLQQSIKQQPGLLQQQGQPLQWSTINVTARRQTLPQWQDRDCLSFDQQQAVVAIERVFNGHRKRPLVVSADRGRGKSAALGIAAARMLQQRDCVIRVTAPNLTAVEPLYERVLDLLPNAQRDGVVLQYGASRLEFVALDQPQLYPRDHCAVERCDLLMVDEAAAIPAGTLQRLLEQHARVVFATTTHGYEGCGRGFQIRFYQTLDRVTPDWRRFELQTPIRWAANDPLERWVSDTLLLDAEPAPVKVTTLELPTCRFEHCSAKRLLDQPELLHNLFGLLVQAHYRTSPNDLRELLDNPSMQVWLMQDKQQHLLGAVVLVQEGGLSAALADSIWMGQRRPQGHLAPQVLAAQAGWRQAPRLDYWRIVRIAVVPELRRQGIGAEMVARLQQRVVTQSQLDVLCTSFAASAELLPFWRSCGLQPLRLGYKPDASSGCVSLLYGSAGSNAGQQLLDEVGLRLRRDLLAQLQGPNRSLEEALVRQLLIDVKALPGTSLDQQDWQDLAALTYGHRGWQQSESALLRWSLQRLSQAEVVIEPQLERFLIQRLIQRRDWSQVLPSMGLSGPRQALQWLRIQLRPLLEKEPPISQLDLPVRQQ